MYFRCLQYLCVQFFFIIVFADHKKKQDLMTRQLSMEFWVRLSSSVSTTFKHSSANSINRGSSIANFIAFQAFGAESTSLMKSRKFLFFSRSLRLSLFAEWTWKQISYDLLPSMALCWKLLTKLSQFIWIHCVFGCKLENLFSRLLRIRIYSVALCVWI